MAVHSNTFGGVQLSGQDAEKFRKQTRTRHKSEAATKAATNGIAAARKLIANGRVKVAEPA